MAFKQFQYGFAGAIICTAVGYGDHSILRVKHIQKMFGHGIRMTMMRELYHRAWLNIMGFPAVRVHIPGQLEGPTPVTKPQTYTGVVNKPIQLLQLGVVKASGQDVLPDFLLTVKNGVTLYECTDDQLGSQFL